MVKWTPGLKTLEDKMGGLLVVFVNTYEDMNYERNVLTNPAAKVMTMVSWNEIIVDGEFVDLKVVQSSLYIPSSHIPTSEEMTIWL